METTAAIGRGLLGIGAVIAIAWACSSSRRQVAWRTVASGLVLHAVLAVLLLKAPWFQGAVTVASRMFVGLLGFTREGSEFVFGDLAKADTFGFIFCFQILPTIIFFSAITSVLYYFGVLQKVAWAFAWVMTRVMRLSGRESLAAAANVFLGQTEAPLVIRPYVARMTRSEIMALMTGGMATIAGGVLAAYIAFLGGTDPAEQETYAKMLLSASLMNAPAALIIAKLMIPETGTIDEDLSVSKEKIGDNFLDALANGATTGLKLALNVGAMLLVFVAFIAMVNGFFSGFVGGLHFGGGGIALAGADGWLNSLVRELSGGTFPEFSLEFVFGIVGAPFAWLIGVEAGDALRVGSLLGTKVVVNEFVGYIELGALKEAGMLSPRSVFLATFALCGFANFSSIGIQLGGIGSIAPGQRATLASLGFRAVIAGTLATLLTASMAGMFFRG